MKIINGWRFFDANPSQSIIQ